VPPSVGLGMVARYRREMRALKAELRAGSRVAQTALGPVEYAEAGEGPPALVVHGICGGYDQGLLALKLLRDPSVRLIALSRPGYLRTPLRKGRAWEQQADLYKALLDSLGIGRAAIVGISGGGPSSLLFALRHPERCAGLVMASAVSTRLDPGLTPLTRALLTVLNTDWGLWLFSEHAPGRLKALNGVGPATLGHVVGHPGKMDVIERLVRPLPMSMRRAGFNNDLRRFPHTSDIAFGQITAPTLVLHGTHDTVVPVHHAQRVAEGVPGAQLRMIEGGGHLCTVTHSETALPLIVEFLASLRVAAV
jgi:pimeloyl-ACP methyl ester carboxylesterase